MIYTSIQLRDLLEKCWVNFFFFFFKFTVITRAQYIFKGIKKKRYEPNFSQRSEKLAQFRITEKRLRLKGDRATLPLFTKQPLYSAESTTRGVQRGGFGHRSIMRRQITQVNSPPRSRGIIYCNDTAGPSATMMMFSEAAACKSHHRKSKLYIADCWWMKRSKCSVWMTEMYIRFFLT